MLRVGSRAQVMHGNAKMTGGGLMKKDLKYNNYGKIVSRRMSRIAKKEMRLKKAGYITTKGVFGVKKVGSLLKGGAKVSELKYGKTYILQNDEKSERVSIKIEESDVDNRILVYQNGILYRSISGDGWMYKEVFDSKYNEWKLIAQSDDFKKDLEDEVNKLKDISFKKQLKETHITNAGYRDPLYYYESLLYVQEEIPKWSGAKVSELKYGKTYILQNDEKSERVSIKIEETDVDNRIIVYQNGILYISISGQRWMYKEVFDSKYNEWKLIAQSDDFKKDLEDEVNKLKDISFKKQLKETHITNAGYREPLYYYESLLYVQEEIPKWSAPQHADNKGTLIIKLSAKSVLIKRRVLTYNNWEKKRVTYNIYHHGGPYYTVYEIVDKIKSKIKIGYGTLNFYKEPTSDNEKLNRLDLQLLDISNGLDNTKFVVKHLKLVKPINILFSNNTNILDEYPSVETFIEKFKEFQIQQ